MLRFSYAFCSPAVLTSRTTGVYMKSHARQKSKNAPKRRSNFNPPRFCISAPSGSRRRPRNRRSVARFFIARPAGTPLALKESAGCLEITFSRGLCQQRSNSTFFLIRGEPHSWVLWIISMCRIRRSYFVCGAFACGANYPHQALKGGYFVFPWRV